MRLSENLQRVKHLEPGSLASVCVYIVSAEVDQI